MSTWNREGFEFEEKHFLGGKLSNLHREYLTISKQTPEIAKALFIMENRERWKKEADPHKKMLEILEYFGKVDKFNRMSEITVLSSMIGDTRERHNLAGASEILRKLRELRPPDADSDET